MLIRNARELGGLLRQARTDAGLTQGALAARLNVRRQRVLYLERGKGQPALSFVLAVMQELGISLEARLGVSDADARATAAPPISARYSIDEISDAGLD